MQIEEARQNQPLGEVNDPLNVGRPLGQDSFYPLSFDDDIAVRK